MLNIFPHKSEGRNGLSCNLITQHLRQYACALPLSTNYIKFINNIHVGISVQNYASPLNQILDYHKAKQKRSSSFKEDYYRPPKD